MGHCKREALLVLLASLLRQLANTCDDLSIAVEQLRSDDRLAQARADLDLATSTIGHKTSIAGLPCWLEEQDAHPASTTM